MNNPNAPNVLVKIAPDESFVAVSTYCRKHGRRGRFLIFWDRLQKILAAEHGTLFDSDCGNRAELRRDGDTLHICFDWLTELSDGTLRGFRQRVDVPCRLFAKSLADGKPIRCLYRPVPARARINVTSGASEVVRQVVATPHTRSALRKALRDNFQWRSDEVVLYRDCGNSFYFSTSSGCPVNGGLILHETTIQTPVGPRQKLYYGVHT